MELNPQWKKQPKDGASLKLNGISQPQIERKVFNNPRLLTRSWYPTYPSSQLKSNHKPKSITIGSQRVTLYRGKSGQLYAIDAFCPHFGADLGNGSVKGENIECYFHQWQFSGKDGALKKVPIQDKVPVCQKLQTYPVIEKFGYVWIYSEKQQMEPSLTFPWSKIEGSFLTQTKLFVHHHALMMSSVDLHHFFSVHNLPIDFKFQTSKISQDHYHWKVHGEIPRFNILSQIFRWLFGKRFTYEVEFYGGNLVSISYGTDSYWFGKKSFPKLPVVQILWASTPLKEGVSQTHVFILHSQLGGPFKSLKKVLRTIFSILILTLLKDDDVKAYPHMKFNPRVFIEKDQASVEFIRQTETIGVSEWSFEN